MYIRTNDGVYLKIRECDENNKILIVGKTITDFGIYIEKKDIINQSENLEELCDGFYIDVDLNVERNFEYAFHHFGHFAKTMKSFRTTSKVMVKRLGGGYGYIRTDKCLLYIGKLNDKGELELI